MQQSTYGSFRPSLLSNLSQMKQVHTTPPYFSKIHFNIIVPHMLRSSTRFLSFSFPTKTPPTPLLAPMRATCPAHLILLYFIYTITFGERHRSQSSPSRTYLHSPVIASHLDPAYQIPLLRAANFHTSLNKA
jgi:hypothetical protein